MLFKAVDDAHVHRLTFRWQKTHSRFFKIFGCAIQWKLSSSKVSLLCEINPRIFLGLGRVKPLYRDCYIENNQLKQRFLRHRASTFFALNRVLGYIGGALYEDNTLFCCKVV